MCVEFVISPEGALRFCRPIWQPTARDSGVLIGWLD